MRHEDYIKAVQDEPELPGPMPESMAATVRGLDTEGIAEWCRILVRETKRGIIQRMAIQYDEEQRAKEWDEGLERVRKIREEQGR